MLYERITRETIRLQQQMDSIKQMVSSLPPGKLVCCHHGKYQKWYQSDGHTKTYIPKSNRNFAEQLAAQTYLSTLLTDLSQEKTASKLQLYISHEIIPSIQLITTYETMEHPLSTEVIYKIVEHYFL